MKVRRFVLFGWDIFYQNSGPCGGWDDYLESFDTKEEAIAYIKRSEPQWDFYQVVDLETGIEVI